MWLILEDPGSKALKQCKAQPDDSIILGGTCCIEGQCEKEEYGAQAEMGSKTNNRRKLVDHVWEKFTLEKRQDSPVVGMDLAGSVSGCKKVQSAGKQVPT